MDLKETGIEVMDWMELAEQFKFNRIKLFQQIYTKIY